VGFDKGVTFFYFPPFIFFLPWIDSDIICPRAVRGTGVNRRVRPDGLVLAEAKTQRQAGWPDAATDQ
jgi:hypothetical protein